jgi:UDPglucose--hexose-1-phosphate uridylyltransferase
LRIDPISGRRVLVAEVRAGRPNDFLSNPSKGPSTAARDHDECPFCRGHEAQTPHSLLEVLDEAGQWQVRVVPNKYPAVSHAVPDKSDPGDDLFAYEAPLGHHEVIVESPEHVRDWNRLSSAEAARVLRVYRDRARWWSNDRDTQHVSIFKNVGSAAGASLEHVHSQLVALPYVPPNVATEAVRAATHYATHGSCIFCDLIEKELAAAVRVVAEHDQWIALAAFAGRQPYETWILPREHSARFELLSDGMIDSLAVLLCDLFDVLGRQLVPLHYNFLLHSAPVGGEHDAAFHWHWELVPRSTKLAGFEWSTGMHINPLSPERAAAQLRCVV